MSTVDLVLLGCLLEKPQSAYDINKQLAWRNLGHWVKLGRATVYKNLQALEAKGYLQGQQEQPGAAPPKTVYAVTEAGRAHFGRLMGMLAEQPPDVHFDMNAMVANLNKVPLHEALAYLAGVQAGLAEKKAFIESMQPQRAAIPLVGRTIMRQQVMVLGALLEWLEEFKNEFIQEAKDNDEAAGHAEH